MRLGRFALAGLVGGGVTVVSRKLLERWPPGGSAQWTRTNHQQQPISLLEGPAAVLGLAAGTSAWVDDRQNVAGVIAALGAGTFGLIDDLTEDTSVRTKGIRGHFGALAEGRLTTGALKVLGIGTTAMVAAIVGRQPEPHWGFVHRSVDVVENALLIAAMANLLNLLDLRPGRALKSAALLSAIPARDPLASTVTGAMTGVAAASWDRDLGSRDMLGDGGANALGAVAGARLAFGLPAPAKTLVLIAITALNVASEKVSFSKVIAETPWLRAIDEFGRSA